MIVPWGDRVREEAQRETDSLRVYVGSVEAAAAGLLSRVQELEHLLALCMHPTLIFLYPSFSISVSIQRRMFFTS
jgi:hypothetical protein